MLSHTPCADEAQDIDTTVRQYHEQGRFDGVVLAARRDCIIYSAGFGYANCEDEVPNTPETRFPITSITKQFTAVLVMQLVEEGRVGLDMPIAEYLPEVAGAHGARITVRHLLMHTSGLLYLDALPGFYQSTDPERTTPICVARKLLDAPLRAEPGTIFQYNNGDYVLLGALLERVTGTAYETLLQQRILVPLGMKDTGCIRQGVAIERLANGYLRAADGTLRREPYLRRENYGAGGVMYSTVADLLLWDNALVACTLLTEESTERMLTPSPEKGHVALGSWVYDVSLSAGRVRIVERRGTAGAFRSLNVFAPDGAFALILLTNITPDDVNPDDLFGLPVGAGLPYALVSLLNR